MSAKRRQKKSNHKPATMAEQVEAAAEALGIEPAPPVEAAAAVEAVAEPVIAEAVFAEAAPPLVEPAAAPVVEPAVEPPLPETLLVRIRLRAGNAVVDSFASLRSAQATAVERTLTWVRTVDEVVTRSLSLGEQFLLARLRLAPTPPPPSAQA